MLSGEVKSAVNTVYEKLFLQIKIFVSYLLPCFYFKRTCNFYTRSISVTLGTLIPYSWGDQGTYLPQTTPPTTNLMSDKGRLDSFYY